VAALIKPAVVLAVASLAALSGAVAVAAEPVWLHALPTPLGASGDSARACAALADDQRARLSHGAITEMDVYRSMGDGYAAMAIMQLAMIVPTLGLHAQRGSSAPGMTISWPGQLPFGPVTACRVSTRGSLEEHRPLRFVFEPGIVVRSPLSVFLRPGVRAIWHRSAWRLGIGAGIGSTLVWIDSDRGAASISPELVMHFGRCCGPGYFLLSLRADRYYPRREPDSAVASLTLTFW
jgi:hypothetical protein